MNFPYMAVPTKLRVRSLGGRSTKPGAKRGLGIGAKQGPRQKLGMTRVPR